MPVVPTADVQKTADTQPAPDQFQAPVATADAAGAGIGRATQALGGAFSEAGGIVSAAYKDMKERENAVQRVFDLDAHSTKLKELSDKFKLADLTQPEVLKEYNAQSKKLTDEFYAAHGKRAGSDSAMRILPHLTERTTRYNDEMAGLAVDARKGAAIRLGDKFIGEMTERASRNPGATWEEDIKRMEEIRDTMVRGNMKQEEADDWATKAASEYLYTTLTGLLDTGDFSENGSVKRAGEIFRRAGVAGILGQKRSADFLNRMTAANIAARDKKGNGTQEDRDDLYLRNFSLNTEAGARLTGSDIIEADQVLGRKEKGTQMRDHTGELIWVPGHVPDRVYDAAVKWGIRPPREKKPPIQGSDPTGQFGAPGAGAGAGAAGAAGGTAAPSVNPPGPPQKGVTSGPAGSGVVDPRPKTETGEPKTFGHFFLEHYLAGPAGQVTRFAQQIPLIGGFVSPENAIARKQIKTSIANYIEGMEKLGKTSEPEVRRIQETFTFMGGITGSKELSLSELVGADNAMAVRQDLLQKQANNKSLGAKEKNEAVAQLDLITRLRRDMLPPRFKTPQEYAKLASQYPPGTEVWWEKSPGVFSREKIAAPGAK